jgi:RimJ/RimL family protein N-acetyltransferase
MSALYSPWHHPSPGVVPESALPGATARAPTLPGDWRRQLPALSNSVVKLRELRSSDAAALHATLATEEVTKFVSPPPTTVDGFERFIAWARIERAAGRYICFAVVPEGSETAVGFFQIRQLEGRFETAEWGFVLGAAHWGTGLFVASAALVLEFVFGTLDSRRLEARAAVDNGRGNGALQKIGAVREGLLRRSFLKEGQYHDQALWSILREDWMEANPIWGRHAGDA